MTLFPSNQFFDTIPPHAQAHLLSVVRSNRRVLLLAEERPANHLLSGGKASHLPDCRRRYLVFAFLGLKNWGRGANPAAWFPQHRGTITVCRF
jgi:hypothetical protein